MGSRRKSGNKRGRGRPRGSYGEFRTALIENADELVQRIIREALKGDSAMLKVCIERLIPRLRPQAAPIRVDAPNSDIAGIGEAVVQSAIAGQISPDAARDVLSALADVARLKEFTELEERLKILEGNNETPPWESATDERLPIRGKQRRKAL